MKRDRKKGPQAAKNQSKPKKLPFRTGNLLGQCSSTRNFAFTLIVFAAALFTPANSSLAQTELAGAAAFPRFTYADLQRLRSVKDVKLSPDGTHVAYVVSAIDLGNDQPVSQLWIRVTAGQDTAPVLLANASEPAWSPDSNRLAVVTRDESNQVTIKICRASDEQVLASFPLPAAPEDLAWSPDGASLSYTLFVPQELDHSFLADAVRSAQSGLAKPPDAHWARPVQITQSARYRRDGGEWLSSGHTHLFVLSTASGKIQQIGSEPFDDTEPSWSQIASIFYSPRTGAWKTDTLIANQKSMKPIFLAMSRS